MTPEQWEAKARYLAAMIALIPKNMIILPTEDDMDLADDVLAQYPPEE